MAKNSFVVLPKSCVVVHTMDSVCPPGFFIAKELPTSGAGNNLRMVRNVTTLVVGSGDNLPTHRHAMQNHWAGYPHTFSHSHSISTIDYTQSLGTSQNSDGSSDYYFAQNHYHLASAGATSADSGLDGITAYYSLPNTGYNILPTYPTYIDVVYCKKEV